MTVMALLRICQVAGLARLCAASSCQADSRCSESEELLAVEDEAIATSTLLLQANLHQSRVSTAMSLLEARLPPGMHSLLSRLKEAEEGSQSDSVVANLTEIPEGVHELRPVLQMVNTGKDESDPVWASVHELIGRYLKNTNAENEQLYQICQSGDMEQYTKKACAKADRQKLLNGVPTDRYYCGTHNSGINWGTMKVENLCKAEVGSAYTLKGLCGSLSKKQLVLNFLSGVHKWKEDPRYMNIPSVACIMGLADCDIHFCQHCSWVGCANNETAR
ncbi:unnamed protein product [Durusdinium trenchii]|uniref:Uncharacterized protein n=2 Tax=Durusdinium trenchii TaxID=1381693 RepID=A0ABP0P9J6_9DINO